MSTTQTAEYAGYPSVVMVQLWHALVGYGNSARAENLDVFLRHLCDGHYRPRYARAVIGVLARVGDPIGEPALAAYASDVFPLHQPTNTPKRSYDVWSWPAFRLSGVLVAAGLAVKDSGLGLNESVWPFVPQGTYASVTEAFRAFAAKYATLPEAVRLAMLSGELKGCR